MMGSFYFRAICAILFFAQAMFFGNSVFGQFLVPTRGPYGGVIHDLVEQSDGDLFCTLENGPLYKSENHGSSWQPVNLAVAGPFNHAGLGVDPEDRLLLFVLPDEDNRYVLYRSSDDGETWGQIGVLDNGWCLNENTYMRISFDDLGIMYVNVDTPNIDVCSTITHRSTDNGITFVPVLLSDIYDSAWYGACFTMHSSGIGFLGYRYPNDEREGTLYKTDDHGENWYPITAMGNDTLSFSSIAVNDEGVVLAATSLGMIRSNDFGNTWSQVNEGIQIDYWSGICILTDASSRFIVSRFTADNHIFALSPDSDSWTTVGTLPCCHSQVRLITTDNFWFADDWPSLHGGPHGLIRSTNNGLDWSGCNEGIQAAYIGLINSLSSGRLLAMSSSSTYISDYDGQAWFRCERPTSHGNEALNFNKVLELSNGSLLGSYFDEMWRSTDQGETWQILDTTISASIHENEGGFLQTSQGSILLTGSRSNSEIYERGLFRSTDQGMTWDFPPDQPEAFEWGINGIVQTSSGALLASSSYVFRSADDGLTWTQLGLVSEHYWADLMTVGNVVFASADGHLFRSLDDGYSWEQLSTTTGMDDAGRGRIIPVSPDVIYSMIEHSVYQFDFQLGGWLILESIPFNRPYNGQFSDVTLHRDGRLYFSTYGFSAYRTEFPVVIVNADENQSEIPTQFTLCQNYPNPFNSATTFAFDLPKTGPVTMQVFDITGRLAATPINNNLTAGYHSLKWDANSLASGIYFYRLKTDQQTQTKKLTLIK
jgi:photosystem II stability/assembly factor-like uncharacterized protein